MPILKSRLDLPDVLQALKAKGYGFHSCRQYPVQLTVASKTRFRKVDGLPHREPLRGIPVAELEPILTNCETVEEAALQIERLSLGEIQSAVEEHRPAGNSGISASELAKLVENRVRSVAGEEMNQFRSEMAQMRQDMAELAQSVVDAARAIQDAVPKAKAKARKLPAQTGKRTVEETDEILAQMGLANVTPPPAE
jgi:hypothetical protein